MDYEDPVWLAWLVQLFWPVLLVCPLEIVLSPSDGETNLLVPSGARGRNGHYWDYMQHLIYIYTKR